MNTNGAPDCFKWRSEQGTLSSRQELSFPSEAFRVSSLPTQRRPSARSRVFIARAGQWQSGGHGRERALGLPPPPRSLSTESSPGGGQKGRGRAHAGGQFRGLP